jgi:hypothetical protein
MRPLGRGDLFEACDVAAAGAKYDRVDRRPAWPADYSQPRRLIRRLLRGAAL